MNPINSRTLVYGVIGNPVGHSLGPTMHNAAFRETGWPGVYVAFTVSDGGAAIKGVRALNIRGISVTIPHKEVILPYLDQVDETARQIGAVNTVVNEQGRLIGYNSDAYGAVTALLEKTGLKDRDVVIIGAGGAARAIGYGVLKEGARLHIVNRSEPKGTQLARDLGAAFYPLSGLNRAPRDILVNTTPVGMHPGIDEMPLLPQYLEKDMLVMDIIYNPLETRLLREAKSVGAATIDGVPMFVYQGAMQFEFWTGREAPVELMKKTVYQSLC